MRGMNITPLISVHVMMDRLPPQASGLTCLIEQSGYGAVSYDTALIHTIDTHQTS